VQPFDILMLHMLPRQETMMIRTLVTLSAALVVATPMASRASAREMRSAPRATETAVFAGGCFWGVEAVFEHVKGVTNVVSGYAGGTVVNPSYERVSDGDTGHAEAVKITYDPSIVSYETLLQVFFTVAHDPTQLNRQGPDVGTQYRSAIFTNSAAQAKATESFVAQLSASKKFARAIVTQVAPLKTFYMAEAYHQDYLPKHLTQPYIVYNDLPKLDDLKKQYPKLWVDVPATR
jgi:peptide-methionine (S)-S-oxide reductase